MRFLLISFLIVTLSACDSTCDTDDCKFESLWPPIVLSLKGSETVVCIDSKGNIWKGKECCSYIATAILESEFTVGDTVVRGERNIEDFEIIIDE